MFCRKFLYGISGLILWSGAAAAESVNLYAAESLKFTVKDGTEYVYNADGQPFSGAVKLPDSQGREVAFFYKNGQKNGVATTSSADNKVVLETPYENGRKNGVEIAYYANGQPQYRRTYQNDVLNGEELLFGENGQPQRQNNYVNGILDGTVNYFDSAGNLNKTETYKNGVKEGIARVIENNSLMAEDTYVNGKISGVSKRYGEKYLSDEIDYVNGLREGRHKHYADDGAVSEIPYHNDVKNGIATEYRPDKSIAQITTYGDDMKNGFEQKFRPDGTTISIENYSNDRLEGLARYFDEQGKVSAVKYFKDGALQAAVDLNHTEKLTPLYNKYKEGKIGPLLKQRGLWYRILWLGITLGKTEIIDALESAMKMYAFEVDDMAIYQRFGGDDFAEQTSGLYMGMTPFMYAAAADAPAEILQKFKGEIQTAFGGETPLQYALRTNNKHIAGQILALLPEDKKAATDALFYALKNGSYSGIVLLLLEQNPDVKTADDNGNTPLDYAFKHNASPDVISALLAAGADISQPKYKGLLATALRQNKPEAYVNLLLDNGADISGLDDDGKSVLYYASFNDYPAEIAEKLRQKGASWSVADKQALIKDAAAKNDVAGLRRLQIPAEQWAEVTADGRSALQYAYDLAAPDEVLQYFTKIGTDINHQDKDGNTILHDALIKGDTAGALQFIEKGAAVDLTNNYGKSAISYVLTDEKAADIYNEVWSKITADDATMTMPETNIPLWKYLYSANKYEALKSLLDKTEKPLDLTDENAKTLVDLLHDRPQDEKLKELVAGYMENAADAATVRSLVKQQQVELLKQIKISAQSLNAIGDDGETLLTMIMRRGTSPDFLQLLLDKGADINQANSSGRTVLDMAIANRNLGMTTFLIEHGANFNKVTDDRTYLMNCKRGDTELTDLLIKRNAAVSHVTADGETTLMAAVKNLNIPLIKYVLEHDIDIEAKGAENRTPLLYLTAAAKQYGTEDAAVRSDVLAVFKLLAEHGANVNARDADGRTLLILMAREHPDFYEEFAAEFTAAGGNSELKDQYDKTAKDYLGGQ